MEMLWPEKLFENGNRIGSEFKARRTGKGLYMGHAQGRTLLSCNTVGTRGKSGATWKEVSNPRRLDKLKRDQ
jgi:hypothetical protein